MCWPLLFPHGGAASAQASPCRQSGAAEAATTTTKPRAPDGPPPAIVASLPQPPAWPGAVEASGLWPALYSGSSDGAQARANPSPAAPLTGSRGALHEGCAFHPSTLQPMVPGCCFPLFLRSAKLGAGEEHARLSRVRAANGGRTEKVPAWASLQVPRAPASSSPAVSAGEWPPDPGSGPEFFRLFLALLPLECAVGNWGEMIPACSVFFLSDRHSVRVKAPRGFSGFQKSG